MTKLQSLFQSAEPLLQSLSLKALVPALQCVFQATLTNDQQDTKEEEEVTPPPPSCFYEGFEQEDRQWVESTWKNRKNPIHNANKLFLLLFFWHRHKKHNLPVLLSVCWNESSELLDAFLDAVPKQDCYDDSIDETALLPISGKDDMLMKDHRQWKNVCLVVQRLHRSTLAISLLTASLRQAVRFTDGVERAALIGPAIHSLLPFLLLESSNVETIWNFAWELYDTKQPSTFLVVTSVLCVLFPVILLSQPSQQRDSVTMLSLSSSPWKQPMVWELIYHCLVQGCQKVTHVKNTGMRRGATAENMDESQSQLLRRRGLYLLRVMEEKISHKSWHKYVACFETAEMEQEPHLMDQIWGSVQELLAEATRNNEGPTENNDMPPSMSYRWTFALLARILVSPDLPVVRKLTLYRLFRGEAGIARHSQQKGAPLASCSPDFLFDIILPSYDSLSDSVGLTMHMDDESKKKCSAEDMSEMMQGFVQDYILTLENFDVREQFLARLLSDAVVCQMHRKTVVQLLECVASAMAKSGTKFTVGQQVLTDAATALESLFSLGSVVQRYKDSLLQNLALILKHTVASHALSPPSILGILGLYPLMDKDHPALREWIQLGLHPDKSEWASGAGGPVATAFVDGLLVASMKQESWDPKVGASALERTNAKAIVSFCYLSTVAANESTITPSELLWPAIHKGMNHAPVAIGTPSWSMAERVARSLLLLEYGCQAQLLSGMGNGDLVVDSSNQMMPPPTNVERVLTNAFDFIHHHILGLISQSGQDTAREGSFRSGNARTLSYTYSGLIRQFQTVHKAFPSSMALSSGSASIVEKNLPLLIDVTRADVKNLQGMCLLHAALFAGVEISTSQALSAAKVLLVMDFNPADIPSRDDKQACRSLFHYARWGALSCFFSTLATTSTNDDEIFVVSDKLFAVAADEIEATPADALTPLFDCVVTAGKFRLTSGKGGEQHVAFFNSVVNTLLKLMAECKTAKESLHMLDGICRLIFRSDLMLDEYNRLTKNPNAVAPIRSAFRELIEMAGTKRPFISRTVLAYAVVGWLRTDNAEQQGRAAVPYLDDVEKLLFQKDDLVEESASKNSTKQLFAEHMGIGLSVTAHDQSVTRGILLTFLSELSEKSELPDDVTNLFINALILRILDAVISSAVKGSKKTLVMIGSPEYCTKMRGWQTLCVMSNFLTPSLVELVRDRIFEALQETLHGQIRYFIEVLAIQCARRFPLLFVDALVNNITRNDLSLQTISSLMIITGNLVVGRHKEEFLPAVTGNSNSNTLDLLISGVIPWLSSTQGFSRAIAQLLVYELIPLKIDVKFLEDDRGNNWYLSTIFKHLDENAEMKRLRSKQVDFFNQYQVNEVCTVRGILEIPVDEGGESFPSHLCDVIKEGLHAVYEESRGDEAPTWKLLKEEEIDSRNNSIEPSEVVNFQRKIIPLDALNLALESVSERRLRTAAGRRKQNIIVCASLIDKIPNLGGLARTSEIFGVDSLVIPDKKVAKMDNFKNLSVGAGDWINIEECKEKVSRNSRSQLSSVHL